MTKRTAAPEKVAKAKAGQFWWFVGASVEALTERLNAAGVDARLEVRIDADLKMTFRVVAPEGVVMTGAATVDINDSFLCPPRCP
ncbi:MAG: hypothetical protein LH467_15255 [Gemmatimonadaceae bacterium]|nr:hypothetical protein [Gemmatimonadaceae bacterium]